MSFGRRLRLFFIGIVAIPMIVIAVLVLQVSGNSRDGKADARLAAGLDTARALYDQALRAAPDEAKRIAEDIGPRLNAPDRAALEATVAREERNPAVAAVSIVDGGGKVLASSGPRDAIATGESAVRSSDGGGLLGTVRVATLDPSQFLQRVRGLTSREVAIVTDGGVLAATTDLGDAELPDGASGSVNLQLPEGGDTRAAALALDGAPEGARLVLFTPLESGFVASEPVVAIALAAFFALAFILIVLLVRNLQRRIAGMLEAARGIGEGDFDHEVPVEGDDEMAGLALELNRMSDRLSGQMTELKRQRKELDESVKRIGEAFASGLDRRALLEIVAETAVSACGAQGGRVTLRDRDQTLGTEKSPEHLEEVLERAGNAAWEARGEGSASVDDCHAIAQALTDQRERRGVLCTMAVGRRGEPFTVEEGEVLRYLVGQTATSIENIDLHERVSEQAFTDELTGIPNHRHFREWLEREVARVDRFGGELSLVLLDIDDFKAVNDTYGHLQGDRVLARMGALIEEESREVDLAARYGGEEFVLTLPETSREGAVLVAERLRAKIEQDRIDGDGSTASIGVTASLGVATMPADGADARALIAAADRALYRAKRGGKNQVVATVDDEGAPPQGNRAPRRS